MIFPFYHLAAESSPAHIRGLYQCKSISTMKAELELISGRFRFVSAKELLEHLRSEQPGRDKLAFLSFDDGLVECFHNIRPMLLDMGIPAAFFINSGFVDSDAIFYRYKIGLILNRLENSVVSETEKTELMNMVSEYGGYFHSLEHSLLRLKHSDTHFIDEIMGFLNLDCRNSSIYMNSSQIEQLKKDGFTIGAHGINHVELDVLSLGDQLEQIGLSLDFCQSRFGEEQRLFSFPFHDFKLSSELFDLMYRELRIDASFGSSGLKIDTAEMNFQRLDMEKLWSKPEGIIKKELLKYIVKKLAGKHMLYRS